MILPCLRLKSGRWGRPDNNFFLSSATLNEHFFLKTKAFLSASFLISSPNYNTQQMGNWLSEVINKFNGYFVGSFISDPIICLFLVSLTQYLTQSFNTFFNAIFQHFLTIFKFNAILHLLFNIFHESRENLRATFSAIDNSCV